MIHSFHNLADTEGHREGWLPSSHQGWAVSTLGCGLSKALATYTSLLAPEFSSNSSLIFIFTKYSQERVWLQSVNLALPKQRSIQSVFLSPLTGTSLFITQEFCKKYSDMFTTCFQVNFLAFHFIPLQMWTDKCLEKNTNHWSPSSLNPSFLHFPTAPSSCQGLCWLPAPHKLPCPIGPDSHIPRTCDFRRKAVTDDHLTYERFYLL